MKLFDSHCHLDDPVFQPDFDAVLARAARSEVQAMLIAGVNEKTSRRAVGLSAAHDGIFASVGVHPHHAAGCSDKTLAALAALAADPGVRAWGEIGLDFNRMYSPVQDQEHWLERQLETAIDLRLPVIFHERDSRGRLIEMLQGCYTQLTGAVVHCFSGTGAELRRYLDFGFHIGVTGIVTMQKRGAPLRELVPAIPEDRLLIETDAPYLTPAPERNRRRRNEPAFVRHVLLRLAEVRRNDPEILARQVWRNTCRLFGIEETA